MSRRVILVSLRRGRFVNLHEMVVLLQIKRLKDW